MSRIEIAEKATHRCQPPMRDHVVNLPTGPALAPTGTRPVRLPGYVDGRLGDLWRCDDCRKPWRVGRACATCDGYGWRPATLWLRIKHRKDGR
jgi:hypothetical protein